jgi:uncharacterized membrane protein
MKQFAKTCRILFGKSDFTNVNYLYAVMTLAAYPASLNTA